MRTTINLADDNRETLLSIAQARGERGVSRVVEEAVAFYLEQRNQPVPMPAAPAVPAPEPGRWQRLGAAIDAELEGCDGVLSALQTLVRGGLRRLPILRN